MQNLKNTTLSREQIEDIQRRVVIRDGLQYVELGPHERDALCSMALSSREAVLEEAAMMCEARGSCFGDRPDWHLERWHAQLKRDILRMRQMWSAGLFDFNLDHACAEFGGCSFKQVCLMKDPDMLLEQQFARRRWDPILREEVPMAVVDNQLVRAS